MGGAKLQRTTEIIRLLPLHERAHAGQYKPMTNDENPTDDKAPGRKVKARMFLLTMLLLFAGTLGILIYAVLRTVPTPS